MSNHDALVSLPRVSDERLTQLRSKALLHMPRSQEWDDFMSILTEVQERRACEAAVEEKIFEGLAT